MFISDSIKYNVSVDSNCRKARTVCARKLNASLKCSDRLPSSVIFAKKKTLKIERNFLNVTEINLEKYKAI